MLVWSRLATIAAAGVLLVASAPTSNAAGSDLTLTVGSWLVDTSTGAVSGPGGTSVLVPSSLVVQPDGRTHRIFDVGGLTAEAGATVRISGIYPAEFRASGPVTLAGTIDASGAVGGPASSGAAGGAPGPGAGSGGPGGAPGLGGGDGAGGISGGQGAETDRCGGLGGIGGVGGIGEAGGDGAPCPSASTSASGNGGGGGGGSAIGAVPSFGPGAGGGGGGSVGSTVARLGGGGGGGGGKVVIRSTQSISVSGPFLATGGRGGFGTAASGHSGGGGGGGGGGALSLDAPTVTFAAAAFIDARGGIRGDAGDSNSGFGGRGGNGTVFVDATVFWNLGSVFPTPIVSLTGPRSLALDPVAATRPVGSSHTITATATDPIVEGLPVSFTISGATSPSGYTTGCVTDAAGQCSITYSGGQFSPGTDQVAAYVDVNNNATADDGESTATATVVWTGPRSLALDPVAATRPVGSSHTITATATDPIVEGLPVSFTISGATSPSGYTTGCVTDAAGQCSITYSGGQFSPGTDQVAAYVDVNNNATADDGESTATATVVWSQSPTYSIHGFGAPVDALPKVNVARAGQTIPLKFIVVDDAGSPASGISGFVVTVSDTRCELGSTLDQLEEYASGGSGLQDFGDGTYQFNWATPKWYAKSCKQLTVSLPAGYGGNALTAEFAFVK